MGPIMMNGSLGTIPGIPKGRISIIVAGEENRLVELVVAYIFDLLVMELEIQQRRHHAVLLSFIAVPE